MTPIGVSNWLKKIGSLINTIMINKLALTLLLIYILPDSEQDMKCIIRLKHKFSVSLNILKKLISLIGIIYN